MEETFMFTQGLEQRTTTTLHWTTRRLQASRICNRIPKPVVLSGPSESQFTIAQVRDELFDEVDLQNAADGPAQGRLLPVRCRADDELVDVLRLLCRDLPASAVLHRVEPERGIQVLRRLREAVWETQKPVPAQEVADGGTLVCPREDFMQVGEAPLRLACLSQPC